MHICVGVSLYEYMNTKDVVGSLNDLRSVVYNEEDHECKIRP